MKNGNIALFDGDNSFVDEWVGEKYVSDDKPHKVHFRLEHLVVISEANLKFCIYWYG